MSNAIQFRAGGSLRATGDGAPERVGGSQFFDPETGESLDLDGVVFGAANAVPPTQTHSAPHVTPTPAHPPSLPPPMPLTTTKKEEQGKQGSFDVVKAAKARLRVIKREIKQLRKLEREQAQLERLLAAADRPLASVANIQDKRTSSKK